MTTSPTITPPKLTAKQAAFCREYLVDLNATQAAIRVGYSRKTARSQAQRLLTNDDIGKEVSRLMDDRAQRIEITADTVLAELMKLALVDIGQAFNEDGSMKPLHQMPEGVRRAIAGVDVFEEFEGRGEDRQQIGFTKKIRLWDKTKALEMLGRHLKLFTDKMEHTGKDGGPIQMQGDERPAPDDVATYSNELHAGFLDFRDPSGEAATLDAQMIGKLAGIVARYAAGECLQHPPGPLGASFARIQCVRRKLATPQEHQD